MAEALVKTTKRDSFLRSVENGRDLVMIMLAYACGLHVRELASLPVSDVDGARKLLHASAGKGRKERLVPFSDSELNLLREDQRITRPRESLFIGERGGHVHHRTVQRTVRSTWRSSTPTTSTTSRKPSCMNGGTPSCRCPRAIRPTPRQASRPTLTKPDEGFGNDWRVDTDGCVMYASAPIIGSYNRFCSNCHSYLLAQDTTKLK